MAGYFALHIQGSRSGSDHSFRDENDLRAGGAMTVHLPTWWRTATSQDFPNGFGEKIRAEASALKPVRMLDCAPQRHRTEA